MLSLVVSQGVSTSMFFNMYIKSRLLEAPSNAPSMTAQHLLSLVTGLPDDGEGP